MRFGNLRKFFVYLDLSVLNDVHYHTLLVSFNVSNVLPVLASVPMMHLPPEQRVHEYCAVSTTVVPRLPIEEESVKNRDPRARGTIHKDSAAKYSGNEYPKWLVVTATYDQRELGTYRVPPTVGNTVAKIERELFVQSLPTRVQVKLDQKFGKDNTVQSFKLEACLRHVLIPLFKSGFLSQTHNWENFKVAFTMVRFFLNLWDKHREVNFATIQGFQKNWDEPTEIDKSRVRMAPAALLLHFDSDIADTVWWIGGPHVGAHRDITATLRYLRGKVDDVTYNTLAEAELEKWGTKTVQRRGIGGKLPRLPNSTVTTKQ